MISLSQKIEKDFVYYILDQVAAGQQIQILEDILPAFETETPKAISTLSLIAFPIKWQTDIIQ